ncbi:MAG: preprotein translocase subunit SecG [Pseudomonadota bacterium]
MIATLITILHVFVAFCLILIVLLQSGKGSDIGAAFGGGSSQTLFGTSGGVGIMTKITASAALVFMITSITLAHISSSEVEPSLLDSVTAPADNVPPEGSMKAAAEPEEAKASQEASTEPVVESPIEEAETEDEGQ